MSLRRELHQRAAIGTTLVVAPFAIIHCVRPQQGDHKDRPYITKTCLGPVRELLLQGEDFRADRIVPLAMG
ncbi:MAG TPA: hypothetical protein VKP67_07315 [Xanthobacteraceae bacterium]|nr:hypothetical protein [Xanthobacteraceae bacterium]